MPGGVTSILLALSQRVFIMSSGAGTVRRAVWQVKKERFGEFEYLAEDYEARKYQELEFASRFCGNPQLY